MEFQFTNVLILLGVAVLTGTLMLYLLGYFVLWTPSVDSAQNEVPDRLDSETVKSRLEDSVRHQAVEIGERNIYEYEALQGTKEYLKKRFREMGYQVNEQVFNVAGKEVANLEVIVPGTDRSEESIVIGAHYDTVNGSPGANDNGTGIAVLLELARAWQTSRPGRTIRFVAFVNEEAPYFGTEDMGSYQYARQLSRENVDVKAMISLETVGYYSDKPGSQNYPFPFNYFYPNRGNFLAFVGNLTSHQLVKRTVKQFRGATDLPAEGAAPPSFVPGVSWSDHWSFWKFGFPAIMVTDTAPYRYPHYHRHSDHPRHVDFGKLTQVVQGMNGVVWELVNG
ncbi:MAG: M28 family peptidase [bacterium]